MVSKIFDLISIGLRCLRSSTRIPEFLLRIWSNILPQTNRLLQNSSFLVT